MGRVLRLTAIGCTGLFGILVIGIVLAGALGGGDDSSSPPERVEKRKGVEQAEKEQAKEPKQEIEKEEPDAGVEPEPASTPRVTVKIKRVVDGDTIEISPEVEGKDTVRLIGIDAPEEDTASCKAQPLAQDASYQMANWKGSKAKLEFDEDRTDQYGRLLAYVHVHAFEDIMLNEDMVLGGLAQVYIVPPNTKYEERLRKAQQEAKENPIDFQPSIWTLSPTKQAQLADHGNGIGKGDGACPPKPEPKQQQTASPTATATASPSPAPNASPNRNQNAPDSNATPENATSSPSPAADGGGSPSPAAGGDIDCDVVDGPIRVPRGSDGDGDGDGWACE